MVFAVLVLLASIVLNFYFFKPYNAFVWIVGIALLIGLIVLLVRRFDRSLKLVYISAGLSIVFNFFLNFSFYPNLFEYQGGFQLAKVMKESKVNVADSSIYLIYDGAHSFDFYRGYNHAIADTNNLVVGSDRYYVVTSREAARLRDRGFELDPVASHSDYSISKLRLKFLDPKKREAQLDTIMLVRLR